MTVKLHPTKTTVQSAIEDGLQILSELRDELQEAVDNMPDSLRDGQRGSTLQESVSTLEGFCDETPDFDDCGPGAECEVEYGANRRRKQSRSDRRDEAVRMLDAGIDGLRGWADSQGGTETVPEEGEDEDAREEQQAQMDRCRELADEIEQWKDEADGVEFPGMYG
jgi:hypothetical protein